MNKTTKKIGIHLFTELSLNLSVILPYLNSHHHNKSPSTLIYKIKMKGYSIAMIFSTMVQSTKVLKRMDKEMDKEFFIIKTEDAMRVNGKTIKCLGLENYTMKQERQLIKANGLKIIFMVVESFTTIVPKKWQQISITKISIKINKLIGNTMKVIR